MIFLVYWDSISVAFLLSFRKSYFSTAVCSKSKISGTLSTCTSIRPGKVGGNRVFYCRDKWQMLVYCAPRSYFIRSIKEQSNQVKALLSGKSFFLPVRIQVLAEGSGAVCTEWTIVWYGTFLNDHGAILDTIWLSVKQYLFGQWFGAHFEETL